MTQRGPAGDQLPHPRTGLGFGSPVEPGTGWPGDLATTDTPIAADGRGVVEIAAGVDALPDLAARVSVCRACPRLVDWREHVARQKRSSFGGEPYWGRPAPSFGDPAPRVLIVGLAPAAHGANRTGRMFTGDRSGDWLYAALYRAGYASQPESRHAGDGLELTGVRITAAAHCAPPANRPTVEELATCAGWLDREFTLCLPTLESILALGGIGWSAVISAARRLGWGVTKPSPKFGHGATTTLTTPAGNLRLVGSYHVSQQNTFTGRLTKSMLDGVIEQL